MDQISIPNILSQVNNGQIRIPKFQRGFVWDSDRVAYLMDSIYKNFPVGSLLFWRTKEKLKDERQLGPFVLPDPQVDYPIDYVLDGQQRLTSIFAVFQSTLDMDGSLDWLDIFYDMEADKSPQETQFVALRPEEVDVARHFPLSTFFNTSAYGKLVRQMPDELAEKIDKVREVFQTANIPLDSTTTDDRSTVAIIFERVNRQGVELDTFQLLTAWTWSEDFQLQDQFSDLSEEIKPFGFGDLGGDTNLILRCCSAILTGDASPDALMSINGEQLRENFDLVTNGIKGAIDFLRSNFHVQKLANMPFSTQLVPLSVFFAVKGTAEPALTDQQRKFISRWFWRSSFSRRYSSGVLRNLKTDIEEMNKLKSGADSSLGDFSVSIPDDFFKKNIFGIGNVNSKTFILLLSKNAPLNLISGQPVDLAEKLKEANRAEFHHLMPKKFLSDSGQNAYPDSILANFVFLNRAENRTLGGDKPSEYKKHLPDALDHILTRDYIPASLFEDDFHKFVDERSAILRAKALELCEIEESVEPAQAS